MQLHPSWPAPWYLPLEHDIHIEMFEGGLADDAMLDLAQADPPEEVPGGSPSWLLRVNYTLQLHVWISGGWSWIPAMGGSEFTISPDPDETGPEGETLWDVAVWRDGEWFQSSVERFTWGRIKSLYRAVPPN